ncbi:MAG: hypothetical protein VW664_10515 [Halieaceae bacterium]|jgi:hypothetical protein
MKITDQQPATREHLTRHGTVEYQIDSAAFPSGIWGRERFTLTRHRNGDRVLRAFCELDDEPALIRDVIQRVDAEFHPQDCVVRLTEGGVFKGSTWYQITDDEIRYEGLTRDEGRIAGQLEIDRSIRGFGTHALNSDAWLVARFDRSEGPCQRTFYNSPLTSLDHRGATGPALECSQGTTIEYFGEETIRVRAGSFACHHFAYVVVATDHPEYHLWVTTDGDFIFVKGTVEAPYNWSFELTELSDGL